MAEKKLTRCVIICGSPDTDPSFLKEQIHNDDYVICADRGYFYADNVSITPDLIVGDFDSFSGSLPDDIEIITLKIHKNDSDSMHCAQVALERGFSQIVLFGAMGGRPDHTYANQSILKFLYENNANGRIIYKNGFAEYKSVGEHKFLNLKDKTFSVFPFGCDSVEVTYEGDVEYPAENLILESSVAMGLSNIFKDDNVSIKIHRGNALIFVNTKI